MNEKPGFSKNPGFFWSFLQVSFTLFAERLDLSAYQALSAGELNSSASGAWRITHPDRRDVCT
jgi:hypothetical protein